MTDQHIVNVTFEAKSEHLGEFVAILAAVRTDLPKVDGCNGVRIFSHREAPNSFTLIEDWENQDYHSTHIENAVSSGAWVKIEKLLNSPPVILFMFELK